MENLSRLSKSVKTVCNFFLIGQTWGVPDEKKNPYRVIGVSWSSQELLDQGRRRAAALGLSFSRYINHLVRRDVDDRRDFVIREHETQYGVSSGTGRSGDSDEALADRIVAEGEAAAARKRRRSSPEPTPGDAPAPTAPIGAKSPLPKRRNA